MSVYVACENTVFVLNVSASVPDVAIVNLNWCE